MINSPRSVARTSPGWRQVLREDTRSRVLWPAALAVIDCWAVILLAVLLTGVDP